jgi:hypothetical protein
MLGKLHFAQPFLQGFAWRLHCAPECDELWIQGPVAVDEEALHGQTEASRIKVAARGGMMSNLADQLEQMRTRIDGVGDPQESIADGLTAQLEQMRIRMNEVAKRESDLAAELNAAVRRMDDQLLHQVRSMAAEHEARRANILNELAAFADQLDGLPDRQRLRPALGGGARGLLANSPRPSLEQDDRQRTIRDALTRLNQQSPPH